MKTKFPQFDSYACIGDKITWHKNGFDITATLEYDGDTKPTDFDCYSAIKIKQWKNDEWLFVGVVLSVYKNGIKLTDHGASLWGVECNYNKEANEHLAEVAQEMESEAIVEAERRIAEICKALCE